MQLNSSRDFNIWNNHFSWEFSESQVIDQNQLFKNSGNKPKNCNNLRNNSRKQLNLSKEQLLCGVITCPIPSLQPSPSPAPL